jgi:hypothetical protein
LARLHSLWLTAGSASFGPRCPKDRLVPPSWPPSEPPTEVFAVEEALAEEIEKFVLDRELSYEGNSYLCGGLRISPGLEVTTAEGPEVLAIGGRETITTL